MKKSLKIGIAFLVAVSLICIFSSCGDKQSSVSIPSVAVGDIITFGAYEQDNNTGNGDEPIEWIVLIKEDDTALLMTKYTIEAYWYHNQYTSVTWENSDLRTWLNGEFYKNAFSAEEQKKIVKKHISTESADQTVLNTGEHNPLESCETDDNVFILSVAEIDKYNLPEKTRIAEPTKATEFKTNMGDTWWTRTPGTVVGSERYIYKTGTLFDGGAINSLVKGVRPVIWIKCK